MDADDVVVVAGARWLGPHRLLQPMGPPGERPRLPQGGPTPPPWGPRRASPARSTRASRRRRSLRCRPPRTDRRAPDGARRSTAPDIQCVPRRASDQGATAVRPRSTPRSRATPWHR
jgi:hypothetical protein